MGKRILTVAALGLAAFISCPASGFPLSAQTDDSNPGPHSQQAARVRELARLVESREPEALARIGRALSDESWYVRGEAARALGKLGDRAAVPVLLPLLQDSSWYVRDSSLLALREIGDPAAGAALLPLLESPDPYARAQAASSLGILRHEPAVGRLIRGLGDEEETVRRSSAAALGEIKALAAVDPLSALLKD